MTQLRSSRQLRSAALTAALSFASVAFVPAILGVVATPAAAAQQRSAARSVDGMVVDKAGAPVKGAVVHLKDTRSLSQRSYITADDGAFRFGQLSSSTDYEVWADVKTSKSATKTISSFDNKNTFNFKLKVD